MGLIELIILSVGLAMDAFAVSICKGLGMKKVTLKKAGIVEHILEFFRLECH